MLDCVEVKAENCEQRLRRACCTSGDGKQTEQSGFDPVSKYRARELGTFSHERAIIQ